MSLVEKAQYLGVKKKKRALSGFLNIDQKNASEQRGDVYFSLSFAKKIWRKI